MAKVTLGKRQTCKQCKHEWLPRQPEVWRCPSCQSFRWNEGEA